MDDLTPVFSAIQTLHAGVELYGRLGTPRRDRAERIVREVFEDSGLSAKELIDRLVESERLQELVARSIEDASRTTDDAKFRMLREAMKRGITDDADIDELLFVEAALRDLERPHLEVLRLIGSSRPGTGHMQGQMVTGGLQLSDVVTAYPQVQPVARAVFERLRSEGIIEDVSAGTWGSNGGNPTWGLTPFGERLLFYLGIR